MRRWYGKAWTWGKLRTRRMEPPSSVHVLKIQREIEKLDRTISEKEGVLKSESARAEVAEALGNVARFLDHTSGPYPRRWRRYFMGDWSRKLGSKARLFQLEDVLQVHVFGSAPLRNLLNKARARPRFCATDSLPHREEIVSRLARTKAVKWFRSEKRIAALERELAHMDLSIAELQSIDSTLDESRMQLRRLLVLGDRLSLLRSRRQKLKAELDHEAAFLAKHELAYAKASAYDNKTRDHAALAAITISVPDLCPYCAGPIGNNPHLDHIYPVSLGGLSIRENLVYCCSECNLQKSNLGLSEFLEKRGLDPSQVLPRLRELGKRV